MRWQGYFQMILMRCSSNWEFHLSHNWRESPAVDGFCHR